MISSTCRSCRCVVAFLPSTYYLNNCRRLSTSSSTSSSFFRETSGRSRRRVRRLGAGPRLNPTGANATAAASAEERQKGELVDNRTVWDLLFPDVKYDDGSAVPPQLRIHWPKSLGEWREALAGARSDYRSTWKGFASSRGFLVDDPDQETSREKQDLEKNGRDEAVRTVRDRARKNADVLRSEAESLRAKAREATGIHGADDLKRWVGDALRLLSDCVKEFMAGYRKGRDDEVEKMLTEYFQELEKKATSSGDKPKRRKRKRRVIQRL